MFERVKPSCRPGTKSFHNWDNSYSSFVLFHKFNFTTELLLLFIFRPKIKEEKTNDEADGAPSVKKIKKEEKSLPKDKDLQDLMKKQNKLMFKYRDELKKLTRTQMSSLLEYNDQDDPVGADRVYISVL